MRNGKQSAVKFVECKTRQQKGEREGKRRLRRRYFSNNTKKVREREGGRGSELKGKRNKIH